FTSSAVGTCHVGRSTEWIPWAVSLTSFSQDHLDFHPTMEAYLAAKCRLASEHLRSDGVAVAAVDGQPAAAKFLEAAASGRRWRASQGGLATAELRASAVEHSDSGVRAHVDTPAGAIAVHSPLVGAFNLDNLLVAIGLSLGLGIGAEAIEAAIPSLLGAPGRLERVEPGDGPAVFVDYAHTPDAVERAIEVVRRICSGRLFVLLGCGGDRDRSKRPIMGRVASVGADRFWATSDNPRTEDPNRILDDMLAGVPENARHKVVRHSDRAAAIADAIGTADRTDVVLIAGKGHEDYQVIGTQRIHFDDREHALAALQQRRP
ncbi:MAG: UDP-N-acetylmuramyl-tripeptide synthetase, partial [Myxococcota bacterium]